VCLASRSLNEQDPSPWRAVASLGRFRFCAELFQTDRESATKSSRDPPAIRNGPFGFSLFRAFAILSPAIMPNLWKLSNLAACNAYAGRAGLSRFAGQAPPI